MRKCPKCKGTGEIPDVKRKGKDTWLTPFCEVWQEQYSGIPPYGIMGRYLAPLIESHGEHDVLQAFTKYVRDTPGKFVSLPRFQSTFGEWLRAPEQHVKRKAYSPVPRTGVVSEGLRDSLQKLTGGTDTR
jgi:hypothetical protein